MASLICRNGLYYANYYKSGKVVRKSLRTRDRDEALEKLAGLEERLQAEALNPAKKDPSPAAFWKEYLPYCEASKRQNSVDMEVYTWRQFLKLFNPPTLGAVTRGDVERVKVKLRREGKKPKTVNNFLVLCRAWYNYATKLGLYTGDNPFAGVAHLEVPKPKPLACSAKERDKIMAAAKAHSRDMYLFCALGFYAGFRKTEILQARWSWFDFDGRVIDMPSDASWQPKNGRYRQIPLPDVLSAILGQFRRPGDADSYVVAPEIEQENGRYRFDPRIDFAAVVATAKVKTKITPHVMRHTYATLLLKAGVSTAKVSQWLGHSSIQITVDTYGHLCGWDEDINKL